MRAEHWRAPEAVWAGTLALALCATAAAAASGPGEVRAREGVAFQAAVGGLGLGRAANLTRCAGAFDPRAGGHCELRHHPLPGAGALCPDHFLSPVDPPR